MVSKGNLPKLSQIPQPLDFQSYRCHWNPFCFFFFPWGSGGWTWIFQGTKKPTKVGASCIIHSHMITFNLIEVPLRNMQSSPLYRGIKIEEKSRASSEMWNSQVRKGEFGPRSVSVSMGSLISLGSRNLDLLGFSAWPNDEETGLSRELSSGSQARQKEVRHRGISAMDPCQETSVEVEFWRSTCLMFSGLSPFCFFLLWLPLLILKIFVNPYCVLGFPGSSVGKESACNAGDPGSIPGLERSPGEGIGYPLQYSWSSLGSSGKEPACNVRDLVSIHGLGDPLEEGTATHSSILAWGIPMDRRAWWATVHGVAKNRTGLSSFHFHYVLGSILETGETAESRSDSFSCLKILRASGWPERLLVPLEGRVLAQSQLLVNRSRIFSFHQLYNLEIQGEGTSLVVQWLRIHFPKQEVQVWSLVREPRSCHAAKNIKH